MCSHQSLFTIWHRSLIVYYDSYTTDVHDALDINYIDVCVCVPVSVYSWSYFSEFTNYILNERRRNIKHLPKQKQRCKFHIVLILFRKFFFGYIQCLLRSRVLLYCFRTDIHKLRALTCLLNDHLHTQLLDRRGVLNGYPKGTSS